MEENATVTPLQATQPNLDKAAPGSSQQSLDKKGTLSAFWNKKNTKDMSVIDVTGDDDLVVLEEKVQPLEEEVFEIQSCDDLVNDPEPEHEEDAGASIQLKEGEKMLEEGSLKKRKRSTLPENTLEDLEQMFSKDPFPSKEARVLVAGKHSIDEKRVTNWFERRRKLARSNGEVLEKPSVTREEKVEQHVEKKESDGPVLLSDDALQALVNMTRNDLENEICSLRRNGLLPPMEDLGSIQEPVEYSEATLCRFVVGQRMTLTELIHRIHPLFSDNKPTEDALRASIACLLQRKSPDPINRGVKLTESMDWSNDGVEGNGLWQWEVRSRDSLNKSCASKAVAIKKRASKVGERLRAIDALLKLVDSSGDMSDKAVAAFQKSSSLAALEEEFKLQQNVEKLQEDKQREKAEREAERARLAEEKRKKKELAEQEKELKRKEREAAKVKAAEEKEAKRQKLKEEKERLKRMKEEENQKKKEESSMQKLAKRTGFKDKDSLNKTANRFKTFFSAAPAAPTKSDTHGHVSESQDLCYFDKRFPKPSGDYARKPESISLDKVLSAKFDQQTVLSEWKASLARSAKLFSEQKKEEREKYMGLPPTWAQKSDAKQAAEQRMQELTGSGLSSDMIQTWRRKFIWFPCDSKRPPFYGSNNSACDSIRARKPFAKESSLDYEVMSDIDWEDEPEGSSLSRDSLQSDGLNETSEEENSFFVADGYLSADEGIGSEEDEAIQQQMEEIIIAPQSDSPEKNVKKSSRRALLACLEKSKRSGKPFIVARSPCVADANHGSCFHGDSALSAGFSMEILLPGALVEVPEDPHAVCEPSPGLKATSPKEAREIGEHAASISGSTHADLLPELSAYIVSNATSTKAILIEGFLKQHSDRKITKKWINENISMLAVRSGSKWTIKEKNEVKPAAVVENEAVPQAEVETPLCTIKAPQTSEKKQGFIAKF